MTDNELEQVEEAVRSARYESWLAGVLTGFLGAIAIAAAIGIIR